MITVAGEALIDLLIAPDGGVQVSLGGAPYNTARACGRLGAEVEFVGALSNDRFGMLLADRLATDGVSLDRVLRVDEPTTIAVAELDGSGRATYRFYLDGTSAPSPSSIDGRGEVWCVGGLGLALEPLATAIESGLRGSRPELVMIDVNCRPQVISDRYLERVRRLVAMADVVKVSDDDLEVIAPGRPALDAAGSLVEVGASAVLLTAGADGVHVVTGGGHRHVPAESVAVVDTVGAGDAFGAGFLVAWCESGALTELDDLERLVDAATFGARVAAVVVARTGADPPWRHELFP